MAVSNIQKFWDRAGQTSKGCWEWQGTHFRSGLHYARLSLSHTKSVLAHRFSWELHYGEIPKDKLVLHSCDNPSCTNPEHLFLGDHKDNALDRERKGRGARQDGSFNPAAKLTQEQVKLIRSEYIPYKVTYSKLAKKYGVSIGGIGHVIRQERW